MKLKNKKTGKITNLDIHCIAGKNYESLAEINDEWEDYEDDLSKIIEWIDEGLEDEILPISVNDFVEKLKAWKRLKDKGFEFAGWTIDDGLRISICSNIDEEDIYDEDKRKMKPDLDLLFGGDE